MKIEHIALWVNDLDLVKTFYEQYFRAEAGDRYHNPETRFSSYFLTFDEGSRLELTNKKHLSPRIADALGYRHIALAVGDKEAVDAKTAQLVADGYPLLSGPRTTGDGYYESVVQDPEGNLVEITTN
jgi:lactoylglutathione lyase